MTPIPSAAGPPPGSEEPPSPPDFPATSRPLGLDRLGLTQAIGGLALGLIALFSSYDHLTIAGRVFPIPQQWGIPLIAASVAIVFVDAELETRARDRSADEAKRAADEADRERNRAAEARDRAAEARERQAEAAERQRQATARLDRCALLSARVLLDPSEPNRARLQAFLTLMAQQQLED